MSWTCAGGGQPESGPVRTHIAQIAIVPTCNFGRWRAPLEKSHCRSDECMRSGVRSRCERTRMSLLSSPMLPKRYVRPSHRTSSKATPHTKDECP